MFAREFFLGVIATLEGSTHKDVYTNVPLAIYMDVLYCLTKVGHLRDVCATRHKVRVRVAPRLQINVGIKQAGGVITEHGRLPLFVLAQNSMCKWRRGARAGCIERGELMWGALEHGLYYSGCRYRS